MIYFHEDTHSYYSADPSFKWTSVTGIIKLYKEDFDAIAISEKVSKNPKSKWYGKTPEQIRDIWTKEGNRATDLGHWYHKQIEDNILSCSTIERNGTELPVMAPLFNPEGYKTAPEQKLVDGIYPEHMMYLFSAGICGQSDMVEVINGVVNIADHKTNKEIKTAGFKNWEGVVKKMKSPLAHLDDCDMIHYNIQLSLYMYMILKHNPNLKPGKITINHIIFENGEPDENGYPIAKLDLNGEPIISNIVVYNLPYLKDEVFALVKHFTVNKDKLLK